MASDSLLGREVVLATGVELPLGKVATTLLILEEMLERAPEHAVALRAACFALSPMGVDEKYAPFLREVEMIRPDGGIERITKHVVLAALRGEGKQLYLVSPYTNPQDRIMSDLLNSSAKAQEFLSPEQVAQLLIPPKDGLGPWTRRVNKGPGTGPEGVPPPSPN